MTYLNMDFRKAAFVAAIAAAALCAAIPAHADQQYQASEARDLCLKEAAAAQAERQHASHGASHRKQASTKAGESASDKDADSKR